MSAKNFGSFMLLPEAKSFSSQLGEALGKGVGNIFETAGETYQKRKEQEQLSEAIERLRRPKPKVGEELAGEEREGNYGFMRGSEIDNPYFQEAELYAAMGNEPMAKQAMEKGKLETKRGIEGEKKAEKYLDEVEKSASEMRGQMASIDMAEQGVMTGKTGILSGDFWAGILHLDELKTASAATIDAAAKTHLMTSLASLSGGRPNIFMERQISKAFALPAASREGNMARLEVLKTIIDMKRVENDEALRLADMYEGEGKLLPKNLHRQVLKNTKNAIETRQKIGNYKIQDLVEPPAGSPEIQAIEKVRKGTPLTQKKASVIFKKANPKGDPGNPSQEEIDRAYKLAEGLGYDVGVFEEIEEAL